MNLYMYIYLYIITGSGNVKIFNRNMIRLLKILRTLKKYFANVIRL